MDAQQLLLLLLLASCVSLLYVISLERKAGVQIAVTLHFQ